MAKITLVETPLIHTKNSYSIIKLKQYGFPNQITNINKYAHTLFWLNHLQHFFKLFTVS